MKGIILAGGTGSRLSPLTLALSKQILPVYDKPMIYYPLSVLMKAGIQDILIISTSEDLPMFHKLLNTGEQLGLKICYAIQDKPNGIAEAFIVGEEFINNDSVCLILGDNIFWGHGLEKILLRTSHGKIGATIFAYKVDNPSSFGVVEFAQDGEAISIEEKPINPKSSYAVPGIYFYDNNIVKIAKQIKPSLRGELEITSINTHYLKEKKLYVEILKQGISWFDTGDHPSLLVASNFVNSIQSNNGGYIACIEEIAYRKKFITKEQFEKLIHPMKNSTYGKYLLNILKENI